MLLKLKRMASFHLCTLRKVMLLVSLQQLASHYIYHLVSDCIMTRVWSFQCKQKQNFGLHTCGCTCYMVTASRWRGLGTRLQTSMDGFLLHNSKASCTFV